MNNAKAIAAAFVNARANAKILDQYPGVVPDSLRAAYECQDQAIDLWSDEIAGWKVARIPPALAQQFPEPRLNGPVFKRNVHIAESSVAECPIFSGGFAAVETEIVIRVAADAPRDKTEWTIAEATAFVGTVHLGIEVASSPLASLNKLGSGAVISDFGNNWGVVVGKRIDDWQTRTSIDCETFIDDISVGKRAVSMLDGPLMALAFTLGKCASRGRPLKRGAWITTGMITGVHDVIVGQVSRHVFAGCGEVTCRSVRATPI